MSSTHCEKILESGAPAENILREIASLDSRERAELADSIEARQKHHDELSPEELARLDVISQLLSTLSLASAVGNATFAETAIETPRFKIGDVVRSSDAYWMQTGQHLAGAILRFEKVPAGQIEAAGSEYWAYLNSGDGPVSLAVLEKISTIRTDARQQRPSGAKSKVSPPRTVREPETAGLVLLPVGRSHS